MQADTRSNRTIEEGRARESGGAWSFSRGQGCACQHARVATRARRTLPNRTILEIARFHHVPAFEADVGHGVGKGPQPHAIDFGKAHEDVKIANPPGWRLGRAAFNAK